MVLAMELWLSKGLNILITRKRLNDTAGFTLLEAMIATMILGFVLVSVLGLTSQYFRYLADMRLSARSSQVLQQQMEDIRLLTWNNLQSLPSTFTDPNDSEGIYAGTITLTPYDSYSGTTTVTKITLGVSWQGKGGRSVTNKLSSLVSDGGLNTYIY